MDRPRCCKALLLCVLALLVELATANESVPPSWRGLWDPEPDEFYTDASLRPTEASGMPLEMRRLVANAEGYHRRNLKVQEIQDNEDNFRSERSKRLPDQTIPRKIWQRCELPPSRLKRAYASTWAKANPEYVHTVCDDEQAEEMVEEDYPPLLEVYRKLRDPQARIDFWSYLVLFKYGGIFASIDSTCERPLRNLIDTKDDFLAGMQPKIASPVLARQVGLQQHQWPLQQWCFASSPGHPILRFLIDYISKNIDRPMCDENLLVDTLLRTGAGPFTDAVMAFRSNPVDARAVRISKIGAFALGQVWGKGDMVTVPCAKMRHGYGFWFDDRGKTHQCDCPTKKEAAKRQRGQKEDVCYVRRRHIEGAGVKSLVKFPELARRRWRSGLK